jgi:hypothetical protein
LATKAQQEVGRDRPGGAPALMPDILFLRLCGLVHQRFETEYPATWARTLSWAFTPVRRL